MERKVYTYWVEIEGKMKGKRNVSKQKDHCGYWPVDDTLQPSHDSQFYVNKLISQYKPQKGTVWRYMRTVVTECVYDDGTVMHWQDLFDVNRTCLAKGDVSKK